VLFWLKLFLTSATVSSSKVGWQGAVHRLRRFLPLDKRPAQAALVSQHVAQVFANGGVVVIQAHDRLAEVSPMIEFVLFVIRPAEDCREKRRCKAMVEGRLESIAGFVKANSAVARMEPVIVQDLELWIDVNDFLEVSSALSYCFCVRKSAQQNQPAQLVMGG